jgi:hypothetical protein
VTPKAAPKVRYLPPPVRLGAGVTGFAPSAVGLIAGLWCAGALAVFYGLPWQSDVLAIGGVALLFSAWAASGEAWPREKVILDWSAQGWHCTLASRHMPQPPVACTPTVVLDLQRLLLVRVQNVCGGVCWLWCQREEAKQWHRFRCALFATRQP